MRPAAVLFDCDGVLADSEGLINALVAADLTARGWAISAEACREHFLGMHAEAMIPVIEARTGPLPADWLPRLGHDIAEALRGALRPIPGAPAAVAAVRAAGIPVAVASNSGREELTAKLETLGLAAAFAGRAFSYQDVPKGKPAPDLYLAAARACGAAPEHCVVVEDSVVGALAGLAAGCRVLGLVHEFDPSVFAGMGVAPLRHMDDLAGLLGLG